MERFEIHWSSYDEQYHFVIGFLTHENGWSFSYNQDTILESINHGFRPFPDMPNITQTYTSATLFPTFRNRFLNFNAPMLYIMKNNLGALTTDKILVKYAPKKEI